MGPPMDTQSSVARATDLKTKVQAVGSTGAALAVHSGLDLRPRNQRGEFLTQGRDSSIQSRCMSANRPHPRSPMPLVLFLFALVAASCAGDEPEAERPPDVAVILLDTLRKDFLDLYGYERETAPYLRSLGERSAVFDRAYSTSSWTAPATATVMTGLFPQRHGVTLGYNAYGKEGEAQGEPEASTLSKLPGEVSTIGELFKANGYQTFGVASNVNISGERGFDRGFERFHTSVQSNARKLGDTIAAWTAERRPERPAFWYLHLNDVHKPYQKRDPWYEKKYRANEDKISRYRSEISYVDKALKELATRLGWDDDTVIVVIADHGEEFQDHGNSGHLFKLYGELVNVPMLIRAPGLTDSGMRIDGAVSLIDVLPTLQDLVGLEGTSERDGTSLIPLLQGGSLPERPLFAHRRKPNIDEAIWAVIVDRWKLIYFEDGDRFELYDAVKDPLDQNDLADSQPDVIERLRGHLEVARKTERMAAEEHVMDGGQEMLDHLREMGYAGDDE